MSRDDITRMAQEAGFQFPSDYDLTEPTNRLERFAALVAAAERNKLVAWMIQFGFVTGHGDTMEQLVDALGSEIVDRIEFEIDTEREACAKAANIALLGADKALADRVLKAIRSRTNAA